ncbi:hypothetical protein PAXRUDRAFT_13876 [Paxillus rubicundulus Ve08.2h10]|uniref:Uncharacterized protein n=1 Tax=Paxillus rubicundulus Ve08.2h10 TaxID=930991 RepID=A0A0D0DXS1_9AGAM|nr:hypothetical protein PAXRUDRAFT_13876 [Paxillus rubicundulus Ve08.2h10]
MRVVSPGEDELPTTAETPGRVTGGQATVPANQFKRRSLPEALFESPEIQMMALAKAIPGILKKPSKHPDSRSSEVSKSMACPKPMLKGKTVNAENAEGSKRRRAPGRDFEEEDNVDGVGPMKKVRQDFSKEHQKAATPFPDAINKDANDVPEVEDTPQSTHKQKAPLPTDFAMSLKMKGHTYHRQK